MPKHEIKQKLRDRFQIAVDSHKEEQITSFLQTERTGYIELSQNEKYPSQQKIRKNVSLAVSEKAFSLDLDEDNWKTSYSLDGRHVILYGRSQIAMFDSKTLNLFFERSITNIAKSIFLHNEQYCAIASDTLFIYNKNGQEVHHLPYERDVQHMVFLPFHFLLVTLSKHPFLRYLDTSMGKEIAKLYIKEYNCSALSQRDDGIVLVGGTKGTVKMFSPNSEDSLCSLLVNSAKITSIAVKKNSFVCSSLQGTNYYDFRNLHKPLYKFPKSDNVALSNVLALSFKSRVLTFKDGREYLRETYNKINSIEFVPYEDILAVGTRMGLRHMIVPGSGDPNVDFYSDSPFLTKKQRREREVKKLLEKIPSTFIGSRFIVEEAGEKRKDEKTDKVRKKNALSRFYQ